MPLVEEVEQTDEGIVGNVEFGIILFNLMHIEHTAVEIGNAAIHIFEIAVVFRRVQSAVEESGQKTFVETAEEAVFASLLLRPFQLVAQIIHIPVEEAFLLDEIAEHQAVEHYRGVPLLVAVVLVGNLVVDARNELGEVGVLFLESCIEVLGDLFGIDDEGSLHPFHHIGDSASLVQFERQALDFLE